MKPRVLLAALTLGCALAASSAEFTQALGSAPVKVFALDPGEKAEF